jgi:beta-glucanase (GH16 family)
MRRSTGIVVAAAMGLLVLGGAMSSMATSTETPSGGAKLDLSGYRMTFNEEFDSLDVSRWGPGSRWIAHTPWAGDFGDAIFSDPRPGFPFTTTDGILRIEARKDEKTGKWYSGLLSSADPKGNGFKQQYGYFEMRAKLPPGPGLWPAFWLAGSQPRDSKDPLVEIDVIEHYGHKPENIHSLVHVWPKDGSKKKPSQNTITKVRSGMLYEDFHTYGVEVTPESIVVYLNREEIWRAQTPPEHKKPLMILLNLAMGPGWPIDKTPNPSFMYVDYVRDYSR